MFPPFPPPRYIDSTVVVQGSRNLTNGRRVVKRQQSSLSPGPAPSVAANYSLTDVQSTSLDIGYGILLLFTY